MDDHQFQTDKMRCQTITRHLALMRSSERNLVQLGPVGGEALRNVRRRGGWRETMRASEGTCMSQAAPARGRQA
eukprot:746277-Hanusia_phi.AAC.1